MVVVAELVDTLCDEVSRANRVFLIPAEKLRKFGSNRAEARYEEFPGVAPRAIYHNFPCAAAPFQEVNCDAAGHRRFHIKRIT